MTHLVLLVLSSILPDELKLAKLKQLVRIWDSIEGSAQICQGSVMAD